MITLTASEIALLVGGELFCDRDLLVSKAPVFDSRQATPGCFFLALKGENADGHDFAADAYRSGAMFSLTSQRIDGPCIVVTDVIEALSILAAFVRKRLDKLIVIGITGSQGKTSTKDLLTHMLGAVGPTVAPAGSFNNDLGQPITYCNVMTAHVFVFLKWAPDIWVILLACARLQNQILVLF